jgi:hypothetical protein
VPAKVRHLASTSTDKTVHAAIRSVEIADSADVIDGLVTEFEHGLVGGVSNGPVSVG